MNTTAFPQDLDPSTFTPEEKIYWEEFLASGLSEKRYHPLDFKSPIELLVFYDDAFSSGRRKLNKKQEEILGLISQDDYTFQEKLELCICAANGSGKDAYIICPTILWLLTCKVGHKVIVTSSSYTQLASQTESYVRSFAERINRRNKELGICDRTLIIKKEFLLCTLTHSTCLMFSTDDPGRAEGHHPYPEFEGAEETIIINEAKTLPDNIFEALSRCTYNRWIEVSSPGRMGGKFYSHFKGANLSPDKYILGERYAYRMTSFDCHHKSIKSIIQDRLELGENSPLYRSKHLAEFTSVDEQVVITNEQFSRCLEFARTYRPIGLGRHAGLDLAKGGDENALYVFDENRFLGKEIFRAKDTAEVTVPVLIEFFHKYNLKPENINADDGHVGSAIIDNLRKAGWPINRIVNQSKPLGLSTHLGNRGAELYFSFARLIQECIIIFTRDGEERFCDNKLKDQLTSRYYTQHKSTGKIILESKLDARAKGHGSPDRADGCVLAFAGVSISQYLSFDKPIIADKGPEAKSNEALIEYFDKLAYGKVRRWEDGISSPIYGSINVLLKQNQYANRDEFDISRFN